MAKDHKVYNGVELHNDQFDAIIDLENMLGQKIPDITKKPLDPFGFTHDSKKNVTEIRLFRSYFNEDYKIKEIPYTLTNLEYLNTIDLSYNSFSNLPKFIEKFEHLENLYLDYNQFEQIPDNITKINTLKQINFNENKIQIINDKISDLGSLISLNLAGNQIKKFPYHLSKNKNLKRINLSRNKIDNLSLNIFEDFSHLYLIDLRNNKLDIKQINKLQVYSKLANLNKLNFLISEFVSEIEDPFSKLNLVKKLKTDPHTNYNNLSRHEIEMFISNFRRV